MTDASDNYYQATRHGLGPQPVLRGDHATDVAVVGGGLAGLSTALHLAERGYRVMVLEAETIGAGASGRSGGQLLPGYSCAQSVLVQQLGQQDADRLWQWSREAIELCVQLIERHQIDCDLRRGHLITAIRPRQERELAEWHAEQATQQPGLEWLDQTRTRQRVASQRYRAALHDPHAAHLHPLNFTLGLGRAAQAAGALLFEYSAVTRVESSTNGDAPVRLHTAHGVVTARQVVLCANTGHRQLRPDLGRRIMPVATYIAATEPLGDLARTLIPGGEAVADMNFIVDYFRCSADQRLLFGGRASYSSHDFRNTEAAMRARIQRVFPQLSNTRIDYCWGGLIDITMNRAPDFNRLGSNLYYLQGFSGHGMALATLAGQVMADTLAGQRERFDVFTRLRHRHFPGGDGLRTPLLMLAMLWFRLRDLL